MVGFVVMIALFWGVSAFFAFEAFRLPWRPPRGDTTDPQYFLMGSRRPWGRARLIFFSVVMGLLGLYVLVIAFDLI